MPLWLIEPRDPLIVRDGRPFGPDPGARARSLDFPVPSTTTGVVRNRAGLDDRGVFDRRQIEQIKQIGVRGPLLVELADDSDKLTWFAPIPADALPLPRKEQKSNGQVILYTSADNQPIRLVRLVPVVLPGSAQVSATLDGSLKPVGQTIYDASKPIANAPRSRNWAFWEQWLATTNKETVTPNESRSLKPVGQAIYDASKPITNAPRFWNWAFFEQWLATTNKETVTPNEIGIHALEKDARIHVSIDPKTQTADEGALFQTIGLSFTGNERNRLALVVESDAPCPHVKGVFAPLGGERRLTAWRQSKISLPSCPATVRNQIIATGCCRVVLLTPACFTKGYRPTWLLEAGNTGIGATLEAIAVPRPQVISGWDMVAENGVDEKGKPRPPGKPKPTRRLVPSGSVLFLRLQVQPNEPQIDAWIDKIWMQNISDSVQDRLDGFGLAALGIWDGEEVTMEVT